MKIKFELGSEQAVVLAVCLALAFLPGRVLAQTTADTNPPQANVSAAAPAAAPAVAGGKLSPPAREVLKMSAAGVAPQVILAYVNNAPAPFHLTSDEIIQMHNSAVSGDVLAAMLNRDVALHDQALLAARGLGQQSAMPSMPPPGAAPSYPYTQQPYATTPQPSTDYGALPPDTSGYDSGYDPYYPYYYDGYPYYNYGYYPLWGGFGGWYWYGGHWNWRGGGRGGYGARGFTGGGFHGGGFHGSVSRGESGSGSHGGGFSGGGHGGGGHR